jgi:hypothetical protein
MSSNTIKSIKIDIKNKKVFITSSSSSDFPRYYSCNHCPYYDKFFDKEGGIEEIQKSILYFFYSGLSQGLSTNYGKAMASFKWEGDKYSDDPQLKINLKNKLLSHFQEYEAKRKCKKVFNVKVNQEWIVKLTTNGAKTSTNQDLAKKFNLAVAETVAKTFSKHGAEIVELA